jgi:hypothetical protein
LIPETRHDQDLLRIIPFDFVVFVCSLRLAFFEINLTGFECGGEEEEEDI